MIRGLESAVDPRQCVTASDLVRHFGVWQERAARAPVYILHRGRPRLALTSLEVMEALCAPHSVNGEDGAALPALLDAIDDVVLITDEHGGIIASSRAARARFGTAAQIGANVLAVATVGGGFLSDAIARVAASGAAEQAEIIPARYPTRRVACVISPFPSGCLIRAHDLTAEEELAAACARTAAVINAFEAVGAATVRIGLRGYLLDQPPSLARMIGVTLEALETVRFVSLVDVAGRVAVGDAIENVIADDGPRHVAAALLVRGSASMPVTIGLTALRPATRIEEVIGTIVPLPADTRPS